MRFEWILKINSERIALLGVTWIALCGDEEEGKDMHDGLTIIQFYSLGIPTVEISISIIGPKRRGGRALSIGDKDFSK